MISATMLMGVLWLREGSGLFGVRELNVAIELWGVAFCAIGIVCVQLFSRIEGRRRSLLLAGFATELVASGGDALAGLFRGQAGSLAWAMVRVGNYATFIGNFVLVAVLTSYLCSRIEDAGGASYSSWRTIVTVSTCIMCALTLAGTFFSIDESNLYRRSELYWVTIAFVLAVEGGNEALVMRNEGLFSFPGLSCLLFYTLGPIVAAIAQAAVYGLNFVIIAGVMSLVVVFFEMQQLTMRTLQERTEELARSRLEVSESRITVMVSQIQPHFLFNTLDTIYGLVDEDKEKTKEAIASFSRYLRTNLDSLKHTTPVPIEREMEHVRTYLELERMSDEGRLEFEFDLQAGGFRVPALSVQTLAENAVKHGLDGREHGGKVIVRTRERVGEYTVAVIDDGVGFDVGEGARSDGIGLSNTRARLSAMCGGTLDVTSEPGVGTTVVMHVPKEAGGSRP